MNEPDRGEIEQELSQLTPGLMSLRVPCTEPNQTLEPQEKIIQEFHSLMIERENCGQDRIGRLSSTDKACDLILDLIKMGHPELARDLACFLS